jgi:hypothetical protein
MNEHDRPDSAPDGAPVELDAAELALVAGGLNPQPLPPHVPDQF